jgi:hypothetical protein
VRRKSGRAAGLSPPGRSPHRKGQGTEPPVRLHQTIAIVREEKKQPGEMIPIAINKLAGLAVDKGKSVYGVASSAPRLYPLRASNAALSLSTMTGTSHCLKVKHSSLSTSATICCNLFVVETGLFGSKLVQCPFVRLA